MSDDARPLIDNPYRASHSRGDLLTDPEPQGWANVEVRDGVMLRVLPVSDEPGCS